jgi:putative membrane protein
MCRLLVVGLLALLAACAEKPQAPSPWPTPSARPSKPERRPVRPVLSPVAYVEIAGSIDLFEIRSAELALTRSADERTRTIARTRLRDHSGSSGQLSLQGRRLNLLPRPDLLPAHQRMFEELYSSPTFDATYRQQQLTIHDQEVGIQMDFAARGSSPTLRQLAMRMTPVERSHLALVR